VKGNLGIDSNKRVKFDLWAIHALAIMRRQVVWNACMVLVFDSLAVLQRAISYDQIGCSRDL